MSPASNFLLVIPARCESQRLPAFLKELVEALREAPFTTRLQIVDDGSPEAEVLALKTALASLQSHPAVQLDPLLEQPTPLGKGSAIQTGWATATCERWLGFVDADGAVPPREVRETLEIIFHHPDPPDVFLAIREAKSCPVSRSKLRHLASRAFAFYAKCILGMPFYDPQCGFKVLQRSIWFSLQPPCQEDGFCFDLELLFRSKQAGACFEEIPIEWIAQPGGPFCPWRDGIMMLRRVYALRAKLRSRSA